MGGADQDALRRRTKPGPGQLRRLGEQLPLDDPHLLHQHRDAAFGDNQPLIAQVARTDRVPGAGEANRLFKRGERPCPGRRGNHFGFDHFGLRFFGDRRRTGAGRGTGGVAFGVGDTTSATGSAAEPARR